MRFYARFAGGNPHFHTSWYKISYDTRANKRFLDKCDYITRLRLVLQPHTRQKTFHRTRIVMYYCFGISFPKFFCQNLLRNFFFQHFFSSIFFQIFFTKCFFQTFFPNIFFQNFFLKILFPTFFQNFFFEGFTLDASLFTEIKRTVFICVMKNMIYSKRSKLDFSLVW